MYKHQLGTIIPVKPVMIQNLPHCPECNSLLVHYPELIKPVSCSVCLQIIDWDDIDRK